MRRAGKNSRPRSRNWRCRFPAGDSLGEGGRAGRGHRANHPRAGDRSSHCGGVGKGGVGAPVCGECREDFAARRAVLADAIYEALGRSAAVPADRGDHGFFRVVGAEPAADVFPGGAKFRGGNSHRAGFHDLYASTGAAGGVFWKGGFAAPDARSGGTAHRGICRGGGLELGARSRRCAWRGPRDSRRRITSSL